MENWKELTKEIEKAVVKVQLRVAIQVFLVGNWLAMRLVEKKENYLDMYLVYSMEENMVDVTDKTMVSL